MSTILWKLHVLRHVAEHLDNARVIGGLFVLVGKYCQSLSFETWHLLRETVMISYGYYIVKCSMVFQTLTCPRDSRFYLEKLVFRSKKFGEWRVVQIGIIECFRVVVVVVCLGGFGFIERSCEYYLGMSIPISLYFRAKHIGAFKALSRIIVVIEESENGDGHLRRQGLRGKEEVRNSYLFVCLLFFPPARSLFSSYSGSCSVFFFLSLFRV